MDVNPTSPVRRRALLTVATGVALLLGLMLGITSAGAATANDSACRSLLSSTSSPSHKDLLTYDACRFDRLDAQVASLKQAATSPSPATTSASPKPSASASPSPTAAATPTVSPATTAAATTCSGTNVTPSTNVPNAVSAATEGTTFCFAAGTYNLPAKITVKNRMTFDGGNRAAVLNGGGSIQYAFVGSGTSDVTIRGFTIQNFATPLQDGAIAGFSTKGWTIQNNHLTNNAAAGVASDDGAKVIGNLIDHNGQQGYTNHGDYSLYDGNEIAYNNEKLAVDPTWEAGGGKTWDTSHATFRNNYVHHNGGNGLWDDTNNIYITYDNNRVSDNWGAGIYHEIGYDATITGNVVTNNGTSTAQGGGENKGWLWDAGIQLRSSGALSATAPTVISGNTVTNNYNGIALLDSPAAGCTNTALGEGRYGACKIQNVLVQNNVVTMRQGASGTVQDGSGSGVFSTQNVKWQNNVWHVAATRTDSYTYGWLAWNNTWPSFSSWQGFGNDASGTFGA